MEKRVRGVLIFDFGGTSSKNQLHVIKGTEVLVLQNKNGWTLAKVLRTKSSGTSKVGEEGYIPTSYIEIWREQVEADINPDKLKAKIKFDFPPSGDGKKNKNGLKVTAGEQVEIVQQLDSGWVLCSKLSGQRGYVPLSYLKFLRNEDTSQSQSVLKEKVDINPDIKQVSRNSEALNGHMGCVVVAGVAKAAGATILAKTNGTACASDNCNSKERINKEVKFPGKLELITLTTNSALFESLGSDIHAEANAVAYAAKNGLSLREASCYVTRAPCNNCYALLASAGVSRIVCPQPFVSEKVRLSAEMFGVEWVQLKDSEDRRKKRDSIAVSHMDMGRIEQLRRERKRLKQDAKDKRLRREEQLKAAVAKAVELKK